MKASQRVSVVFIRRIKFPRSVNPPWDEILMWYWENWDNGSVQSSVPKHTQGGRHDEMQTRIVVISRALHSPLAWLYSHRLKLMVEKVDHWEHLGSDWEYKHSRSFALKPHFLSLPVGQRSRHHRLHLRICPWPFPFSRCVTGHRRSACCTTNPSFFSCFIYYV